jgi:tryptophan-rich sensory protein
VRSFVWLALCIVFGISAYACWWAFLSHGLGLGGHHDAVRRAEQEAKTTFWMVGMFGFAAAALATFVGFVVSSYRWRRPAGATDS